MNKNNQPYPEYASDVAFCREIHRRHGKSFYFGTLLLDSAERDATCVLYAFFRFPDEYVDTYYADRKDIALEKLTRWSELWKKVYRDGAVEVVLKETGSEQVDGSTEAKSAQSKKAHADIADESETRILRATRYVFQKYQIPFEYSHAFLAAMIQDTNKERYETYAELVGYMYGSAGVVGLMMTYILCAGDARFAGDKAYRETVLERARALGEAFQMTNFLRDIGEDIRDRGRIYLPQEDMRRYGVTDADLEAGNISPAFIQLMQFEIKRTQALYNKADEGIAMLPRRAAKGIFVARVLYSKILPKIEAAGYDVFSSRVHLSFLEKVGVSIPALVK